MELDKDLPFEALLKLEQKLGSKTFRKVQAKNSSKSQTKSKKSIINLQKYDSDEAPEEMSSKKPSKKSFVQLPRPQRPPRSIDPRFNPRSGEYKPEHFRKNFQFAFDLKDQELEQIKKSVPTTRDPEEKEKAKYLIQRMENQKREYEKRKLKTKPIVNKDGLKYFPNRKEQLTKDLVAKYVQLKESGKLESHLEKRRKRQAGKERKRMDIEKT